ncbi:MAG: Asp-tRNA(Asn)/Glu-tRNA(Gln) amidotransferase subunit GatA [Lachnospiraceae bacterium]|nr:Asp-tRNA(Asn)/Glu-tRNA(Gln) amidotransferase subunit GatA [Lachnospiraceae bacterium]
MEKLFQDALALSAAVRGGEVSVTEVVEACLSRIEKSEPALHGFITVDAEGALSQAKEMQKKISSGEMRGPLAGVPIAVKDNISTWGLRTTCASRMLADYVPVYDATAVAKLRDAGMIVIGKTNLDEFAMGSTTETSFFGVMKNPWDLSRVPGGSSGGSCASVAAGEVPLALGTDTGGSIRQPSAFCGVVGLKPTYGTVSRSGLIAYASSMDHIGTIAGSVRECAALLDVIAGKDEKDSTAAERCKQSKQGNAYTDHTDNTTFLSSTSQTDLQGMKIGVPQQYLSTDVNPQVKDAVLAAAGALTYAGAEVEMFDLPMTDEAIAAYYVIACAEASANLARFDGVKYGHRAASYQDLHEMVRRSRSEGFGAEVKQRILLGTYVLRAGFYEDYYLKAQLAKEQIAKAFAEAFERYDVILTPTAPTTAPKLGESLADPLAMYLGDVDTVAVNLAGLPAISVPCGLDSQGLPIGLQIIGNHFREDQILRVASAYEAIRGEFMSPCDTAEERPS